MCMQECVYQPVYRCPDESHRTSSPSCWERCSWSPQHPESGRKLCRYLPVTHIYRTYYENILMEIIFYWVGDCVIQWWFKWLMINVTLKKVFTISFWYSFHDNCYPSNNPSYCLIFSHNQNRSVFYYIANTSFIIVLNVWCLNSYYIL